jgi:hypothetical protein
LDEILKSCENCEKNAQELSDPIKRPNTMGTEEGEREDVQAKCIHNIISKTMAENFPNLEKGMPIQIQEASRTPDITKIEPIHDILLLKQPAQRIRKEF